MEAFEWSETFITGIDFVDEQHEQLVGLVNRFSDGLTQNELAPDDLGYLLHQLAVYSEEHFRDEEELMRTAGIDPRHLEAQVTAHADFIAQVEELAGSADLSSVESGRELLDFLIHWLAYHILGMDQNMARQLEFIEQGSDPADVYAREERERAASSEPLLTALNGLFAQVSAQNRELESLVEERTRELVRANAALEAMSMTDALTELPNRRRADAILDAAWENATAIGADLVCVMIDADHFKEVNDTYGHDKGDLVLQQLASTLSRGFRSDDVVCRIGGDEFFVICPATSLRAGVTIAESARSMVAELRVPTGGEPWIGSVSVGVAARGDGMTEPADILKAADEALYAAKDAGKNCVRPLI